MKMIPDNIKFDFTVLMAVYKKDNPRLFKEAIESVFKNSLLPEKFLIVADGPLSVDLEEILGHYADQPLLKVMRLPVNRGLANALNAGLEVIDTTYTVRADADDTNLENRFSTLAQAFQTGSDLIGSDIMEISPEGQRIGLRKVPSSEEEIKKFIKKRNPFNHMTVAFRTKIVQEVGGYPLIHLKEDYALWATLLSRGAKVKNIPEVLVHATTGLDMYRRRGGWKYAFAEFHMQKHLVNVGIKSHFRAWIDGLSRAAIFLAPNSIREWVYLNHLRHDLSK